MTGSFTNLSRREYSKLRGRSLKWVERCAAAMAPLPLPDALPDVASAADGFLVLNGGVLAGCTPYQIRQLLLDSGAMTCDTGGTAAHSGGEQSTPTRTLYYGSTLPFVLVRRPLCVAGCHREEVGCSRGLGAEAAAPSPLLSWSTDIDGTRVRPSGAAMDGDDADVLHRLYVLPVPAERRVSRGGSSLDDGARYLLLLPCYTAPILRVVAAQVQREVMGMDHLLTAAGTRGGAAVVEVEAAPRVLECCPVEQIPGLFCVRDFLTLAEHDAVLAELDVRGSNLTCEYLARRRVAHFNRRFIYGANTLGKEGEEVNPHPSFYTWMRARLCNADPGTRIRGPYPIGPRTRPCDQLTVNYYQYDGEAACGIAAHVDAHSAFDDDIFIVSLGSHTVLEYMPYCEPTAEAAARGVVYDEAAAPYGVYVAPRSLLLMTGECRYGWTHTIAERRTDTLCEHVPTVVRGNRVSLTWRRGRDGVHRRACCPYKRLCDGE